MDASRPLIVDSQIHFIHDDSPEHPWRQGSNRHGGKTSKIVDMVREMDRAGVDAVVMIPALFDGSDPAAAIAAAQANPSRFAVMPIIDLTAGVSFAPRLAGFAKEPGVLAVRAYFDRGYGDALMDGSFEWIFEEAERLDLPLLATCPGRVHLIGEAAERHPTVKITLDHLGFQTLQPEDDLPGAVGDLLKLGKYPNVSVKASCLPSYTTDPYPFRSLFPQIRRVIDAFGPERVFWGSDLTRLRCDYTELVSMFLDELDCVSSAELELMMGKALCQWFDWDAPMSRKG